MIRTTLAKLAAGLSSWLLHIGLGWAVLTVTVFAVVTSVLITGLGMHLTLPNVPYADWIYMATLAPAIGAPIIAYVTLSLAFRLKRAEAELAHLARTDALTGLGNRRSLSEMSGALLADAARRGQPVSLLLIDVDDFKLVNDRLGHATGDDVLAKVAGCFDAVLRSGDLVCRWGGEEFCVMVPQARLADAIEIAERLRRAVSLVPIEGLGGNVTVSVGVASGSGAGLTMDELLHEADRQLYAAKAAGRNRVFPERGASTEQRLAG